MVSARSLLPLFPPREERAGERRRFFGFAPLSGSTAVEFGACALKNDLFDMSLKMISTIERLPASSWDLPIRWHADRSPQEQVLQFSNHHLRWCVAVEELEHLIFQRMIRIGPIEPFGMLVGGGFFLY